MAAKRRKKTKRVPWSVSALPSPNDPRHLRTDWWHDRVLDLIGTWNSCVQRANAGSKIQASVRTPTETNIEIFWGLHRWCANIGVDAGAWIVTIFEASGYKAPPRQSSLFSEAWKKHYDNRFGSTFADAANLKSAHEHRRGGGNLFRPFVDLYPAAEAIKRDYLARGLGGLCLLSVDVTFGFHPQSEHCAACPESGECAPQTRALAEAL